MLAKRAVLIGPATAEGCLALAGTFKSLGRKKEAARLHRQAVKVDSRSPEALAGLGFALLKERRSAQAKKTFRRLMDVDAEAGGGSWGLAQLERSDGLADEAQKRLLELADKGDTDALWAALHVMPPVYGHKDDIPVWRTRFEDILSRLEKEVRLDTEEARREAVRGALSGTNFSLAYQGMNDKSLQIRYGSLLTRVSEAFFPRYMRPRQVRNRKPRIGFCSFHFRGHTIGKLFGGWLRGLDRRRFEVYCYYLGDIMDEGSRVFRQWSDHYRNIPDHRVATAAEAITRDSLDALIYPDLGMDPYSMLLSTLRLAPVQCVSFGHPVTPGIPAMDWFLTSEMMENENVRDHYAEEPVLLPHLCFSYGRPPVDQVPLKRELFGFVQGRMVYLVSQNLIKLHPEDDHIWPRIAARVPGALFVFLRGRFPVGAMRFMTRLKVAFAQYGLDAEDYVRILNPMPQRRFLALNRAVDVFLDTPRWSGGNTSLEAASCGLPLVTLPGEFMRSMPTKAVLERMGQGDLVCRTEEEYVDYAVRLGLDEDLRRRIGRDTAGAVGELYGDPVPVRALEVFLEGVIG